MGLRWIAFGFALVSVAASAAPVSLDQLAAMQTLVRSKVDGAELCAERFRVLSKEAMAGLPMLLEARVREKLDEWTPADRKAFFSASRIDGCVARCRCGTYADWLGEEPASDLAGIRARLLSLESRARSAKRLDFEKCAKANQDWICKHPVFRAVISEAKKNAKGSGE